MGSSYVTLKPGEEDVDRNNGAITVACPKNEEGRTGAYAQTDANTTDRQNQFAVVEDDESTNHR
jgi:hypothetical protein